MKKRFLLFALALTLSLGFVASSLADMSKDNLLNEARMEIREISQEEAKVLYDHGKALFLDCRNPREYRAGHVPGAVNIPRGLLEFDIAAKAPDKNTNIVVYCRSGGRASLAVRSLNRMGYKNAVNLIRGWMGWDRAEYPVE